jgi:hypothetical protein
MLDGGIGITATQSLSTQEKESFVHIVRMHAVVGEEELGALCTWLATLTLPRVPVHDGI